MALLQYKRTKGHNGRLQKVSPCQRVVRDVEFLERRERWHPFERGDGVATQVQPREVRKRWETRDGSDAILVSVDICDTQNQSQ